MEKEESKPEELVPDMSEEKGEEQVKEDQDRECNIGEDHDQESMVVDCERVDTERDGTRTHEAMGNAIQEDREASVSHDASTSKKNEDPAPQTEEDLEGNQASDDEERLDGDKEEDPKADLSTRGFTSEIFKIMLRNLPMRFGFQQLRKMLEGLELKPKKIKALRNKDYAFVTFLCEEDRQKAMEVLNKHTWKGRKLSTKVARPIEDPMIAHKRRQESQGGDGKKGRSDQNIDDSIPVEERLNDAVTPLWRQDYKDQLEEKQKKKKEFLTRLTNTMFKEIVDLRSYITEQRKQYDGLCCALEEIKPSPITTGYRNKCEFSIGKDVNGEEKTVGFRLGLYKGGQISVVNPASCINVPDRSKAVVQAFQTYIRQSPLQAYDPMTHRGHWRMLTVRTTQGSGVMAMVTFHRQSLSEEEVEKEKKSLVEFFGAGEGKTCVVTSLYIHVQWQGDKNAIKFDHIYGDEHITEDLFQLKFRVSPQAFFQVNTVAAEVLYRTIAEWAEVDKTTTLLDICCGTGTIGISLAKKVEKVIGVEMNQQAVEDAKENAAINGVDNVTFHCGKAEDLLPAITNKLHHCLDVVGIVDPPRAGLHQRVVQAIRRCPRLNRLIYVSCDAQQASSNFMNLCRSMSKKQKGVPFRLVKAIPVDLFPHAAHCELILLFERNLQKCKANGGEPST